MSPHLAVRHLLKSPATTTALLCLLLSGTSCRTPAPLPPVNLSAPGWRVRQGQAVWQPSRSKPELTGNLLLATHTNGDFLVQFTKTPFPLVVAQAAKDRWQIIFGANRHHLAGTGQVPERFVWFELPHAFTGLGVSGHWQFERGTDGYWTLNNPQTGETLEGRFFP